MHHKLGKMKRSEKKDLALKLIEEVSRTEKPTKQNEYQDTDFENPFNTAPPAYKAEVIKNC